jgi:hypothetical protein
MTKRQPNPGQCQPCAKTALECLAAVARAKVEEHRSTRAQCWSQPYCDWQMQEWQALSACGAYQMLAGAATAHSGAIRRAFLTDRAGNWLELRCANAFWFWSVLNLAAKNAATLPLTIDDVQAARDLLRQALPAKESCKTGSGSEVADCLFASPLQLTVKADSTRYSRMRHYSMTPSDVRTVANPLFD